jgi:hypothetical protein
MAKYFNLFGDPDPSVYNDPDITLRVLISTRIFCSIIWTEADKLKIIFVKVCWKKDFKDFLKAILQYIFKIISAGDELDVIIPSG